MPCIAGTSCVFLVVGTTEKLDIFVTGIHVMPQLVTAIRTVKQIAEYAFLTVLGFGCSSFGVFYGFLNQLKSFTVNYRLVNIFKNYPVFF